MRFVPRPARLTTFVLVLAACNDDLPSAVIDQPVESIRLGTGNATAADWIPGAMAPDASAYDVNDEVAALSDLEGLFVLLEVAGAWCAPSRALAPILPDVEQTLRDEGLPFATAVALVDGVVPGQPSTRSLLQSWLDFFYTGEYSRVWHMNGSAATAAPWLAASEASGNVLPVLVLLAPDRTILRMLPGGLPRDMLLQWIRDGVSEYVPPATVADRSAMLAGAGATLFDPENCTPGLCGPRGGARFIVNARYAGNAEMPVGHFSFKDDDGTFVFESDALHAIIPGDVAGSMRLQGTGALKGHDGAAYGADMIRFDALLSHGQQDTLDLQIWIDNGASGSELLFSSGQHVVTRGNVVVRSRDAS